MKKKIVYIVGTRPEIIRSASIILALKQDRQIEFKLVHTGQHYNYLMDRIFFKELNLPKSDINLEVGSGRHGEQTAKIMLRFEKFLLDFKPDMVAVFGDTNSSLAAALAAVKLQIPLAHLEAGAREWEMDMPEEINRRLIDHCSNLLLAVSENCVQNLKKENVLGEIYNTGDPLYDVFKKFFQKSLKLKLIDQLGLKKKEYILLTLHRPKNVDDQKTFEDILSTLALIKKLPIVFPVHPRTRKQLGKLKNAKIVESKFIFIDPLSYQEILHLVNQAKIVVTDSGGLQKEAFWAKVPCITLREHTAWIETVNLGVNFLTDANRKGFKQSVYQVIKNDKFIRQSFLKLSNPYVKKDITKRIVELLKNFSGKKW